MISVIVPIYNVEEYLVRCLESLKIQTYPDYEVLMIDDGSTDSSGMIAESFADNDKFRYFRQKNQGQGAARNTGIEKAKGKYLAFVDSDDWVSKDYLKTMYDALVSADADVTNCHTEYVWSSGKHAPNPVTNLPEEKTTDILKFLENTSFASWNKLYKKELFDDIRFPVKMKYEDYACIPQVIGRAKSVICIEDTLYYYFQRDNSTIHSSENLRDMLKAQRILESSSLAEKYPQVLQRYFFRNIIGSLVWHLIQENGTKDEILSIIRYGHQRYPNLNKADISLVGGYKIPFGYLILHKYYNAAKIYRKIAITISRLYRNIKCHI